MPTLIIVDDCQGCPIHPFGSGDGGTGCTCNRDIELEYTKIPDIPPLFPTEKTSLEKKLQRQAWRETSKKHTRKGFKGRGLL